MEPYYETPKAFELALKKAIANAVGDPGILYRQMLRDRFLCRVFACEDINLVLKGGSGMLARIPDVRATRDIDFGLQRGNRREGSAQVLKNLNVALASDLGDWCRFDLSKCEETLDDNGYSRLLKLRYRSFIGDDEKDPILIDLSLDCETTLPPERLTPANRVPVEGIETCDYLVCSLPDQLADKLCAIMEKQPGGWPSSRMKDLVDVVAYATNERFELRQLRCAIECECVRRSMEVPVEFAAPKDWEPRFTAFAKKNAVSESFVAFDTSATLAAKFFNPALANLSQKDAVWSPSLLEWVDSASVDKN